MHEIGHNVVKNGFSLDTHSAECAADAYTALRHIQIFGNNRTDFFKYYGNRASTIVLGISPIHYTNNVTQKIKQLSKEIDISKLSLPKTAKLAEKIALENKLDKKTLQKISKAFLRIDITECFQHVFSKFCRKRRKITTLDKHFRRQFLGSIADAVIK